MKILVPVDGSRDAMEGARMALDLARAKGGQVALISVVPYNPSIELEISARARDSLEGKLQRQAEEAITKAKEFFQQNGMTPQATILTSSSVADEIIKLAKEEKFDLIVIGSRGVGASGRFFLGGTALKVVSHAPCSVLVSKAV